jgi:diacylglycerol kinase family enzyme
MARPSHLAARRRRRVAAAAALLFGVLTIVLAVILIADEWRRSPFLVVSVAVALAAGAYGIVRRGAARVLGLGAAFLLLLNAAVGLVEQEGLLPALVIVSWVLTSAAATAALRVEVAWPRAKPPERPVLFWNPRSGDGKAQRLGVAEAARARGIEPVELSAGEDLERLAHDAVARGADALAMAGGDGSQALVAGVASEHGVPFACVPAGTRNHFALDLGVDRDDVIGALDAFVDGGERVVDLAEVGGRVFVNNVSIGLYAEAVQDARYRGAKLRTLLDTLPDVVGPGAGERDVRWTGPEGERRRGCLALLVANNRYRLGRGVGSGTRPRLEDGLLGVTVVSPTAGSGFRPRRLRLGVLEWCAPSLEIDAGSPVAVGIDGEAARLQPPLRFRSRPGALRVRISRAHPGASPSAFDAAGTWDAIQALAAIAAGGPGIGAGTLGPPADPARGRRVARRRARTRT